MSQSLGTKYVLHRGQVQVVELLSQTFINEHLHYVCKIGSETHTYPHTHLFESLDELNLHYGGGVDERELFLGFNENIFG